MTNHFACRAAPPLIGQCKDHRSERKKERKNSKKRYVLEVAFMTAALNPETWNVPLTHIHINHPSFRASHRSISPESSLGSCIWRVVVLTFRDYFAAARQVHLSEF
jgi:hypothetical protein